MENSFLTSVRKQFEYYKMLGDKTFAQLTLEQLFWQPNEECNSVATIVKHLWGNMLSRWTDFLTTDGEKEWRQRDAEFENDLTSREGVIAKWEAGWACLFAALDSLTQGDLGRIIYIRNQGHTVMEAINRQLAHYPYHVGQIVMLGKLMRGTEWQSLSIPRGQSATFNAGKFSQPQHRAHFTDDLLPHAWTKVQLIPRLREVHSALWKTASSLTDAQKLQAPEGKWNSLQHVTHIHMSVEPVAKYLTVPKEIIAEKFGRAGRPSMTLEELTAAYQDKISSGPVAPARFTPALRGAHDLPAMIEEGQRILAHLVQALEAWTETELDAYYCPHPLLGNLTVREMLMFTALHGEHHRGSILRLTA